MPASQGSENKSGRGNMEGRRGSRRMLVQALYQYQISAHSEAELIEQFKSLSDFKRINRKHFKTLLAESLADLDALDAAISDWADRPVEQLDPVERAVLWMGLTEMKQHADVPPRVVINEAVELAKIFGSQDGYRYVNAVLDKAAAHYRAEQ